MYINKLEKINNIFSKIKEDVPKRLIHDSKFGNNICDNKFNLFVFEQVWPDTTIGFPEFGGERETVAFTIVIVSQSINKCLVYFNSRFAYAIPYNARVRQDIDNRNMASVVKSAKYLEE